MSRDAADQALAGLGATYDRIAAAMFALDSQPALGFLRSGGLAGATETRWQTLQSEIDLLWAQFTMLNEAIEQARGIRAGKRPGDAEWAELTLLLTEPTVGLNAAGLPADGSGPPASWVRLWDLAQQLERRVAAAVGFLSEVDGAWTAVARALGPISDAADALAARAAVLGISDGAEATRAQLDQVQRGLLSDPIAAAPGGTLTPRYQHQLDELRAAIDAAGKRLADITRLRETFPLRISALRRLADEVAAAEQAAAQTYATVNAKIRGAGLPPIPSDAGRLRATAEGLDQLGRGGAWSKLNYGLGTAEQSGQQALVRLTELRANANGLIARRDELRGRLDAYKAKAASKGLAEHSELGRRYDEAHTILFTAPCDLRAATRATVAYQQTLNTLLEE